MGDQQNISQLLAALAGQRSGGTPGQAPPSQAAAPGSFAGAYPTPTPPTGAPNYALPPPDSTGSLNLNSVKPVSTGSVSIADAIAKARGIAAEKGIVYEPSRSQARDVDSRGGSRPYRRSRSPSRTPPRIARDSFRDNYNPYRDERRDDRRGGGDRGYTRDRSSSPRPGGRGPRAYSPPAGRAYGTDDLSPGGRKAGGDDNSETITIESNLVGLIIGRQGESLRKVESETGARVQFLNGPESSGTVRHCRISGSKASREDAKAEISRIISDGGGGSRAGYGAGDRPGRAPPKQPDQPPLREGESTTQIMVPDRTVGLIIGRGGETIRDLQERSGCHVNIVGENKSVNGLRPVNLIGSPEATQQAKDLILEIVESDTRQPPSQPRDTVRGGPPGGDFGGGERVNDQMFIPGDAVGMIIGRGGETIKEMQQVTGCKINIQQPAGHDVEREIGLSGSRNAIEQARRMISEKLNSMEQRSRPQGPRRDDPYNDQYSQSQQSYPQYDSTQGAQPTGDSAADPYAVYGGYQNYVAMWYAAMQQQQQPGGQGPSEGQPGPPGV